jgi:exodeoxyribonuclease-3
MKIISWNTNGIRSVYRKGFLEQVKQINPDILCIQETKADISQLSEELRIIPGYHTFFNSASKKGYSGVAIYTKQKPLEVNNKLRFPKFDNEGRILVLTYPDFILINLYLPHGGRKKEKLDYKLKCYKSLFQYLSKIKNKNIILIGDFNIAHKEIDLERPKQNRDNIMFTKKEREQIDKIINLKFIDSFRKFNHEGGNYTWWPYMANARQRNIGWRIDYIFISNSLEKNLKQSFILKNVEGSDHCPIGVEI